MRARTVGALVALAISACRPGSGRLASVGDLALTKEDLAKAVSAQTGQPAEQAPPEVVAALFEDLLEQEVLLASSPDPADHRLAAAARGARARELLTSLCPPPSEPSAREIDDYLNAHPGLAPSGDRILLRQLILPDEAAARSARDKLREGGDFAAISREMSQAPNATTGGRLGWVEHGQLPPKFEAAVVGLNPGQVSDPVESNAGWHVFQVVDKRSGMSVSDPDLRAKASRELAAAATEKTRHACLLRLAAKAGVEVDCENATFPCRNPFVEAR